MHIITIFINTNIYLCAIYNNFISNAYTKTYFVPNSDIIIYKTFNQCNNNYITLHVKLNNSKKSDSDANANTDIKSTWFESDFDTGKYYTGEIIVELKYYKEDNYEGILIYINGVCESF